MLTLWLALYAAAGVANYALFAARGNALLFTRPKRRDGDARVDGAVEAAFFILAWPVQVCFFVFTVIALPAIDRLRKELRE